MRVIWNQIFLRVIIFQSHYAFNRSAHKILCCLVLGTSESNRNLSYISTLNMLQHQCMESWLSGCIMWYWMFYILLTVNLSFIADRIHRSAQSAKTPYVYKHKTRSYRFFVSFPIMTLLPSQYSALKQCRCYLIAFVI